jgi:CBS domain-containing protein
MTAGDICTRNVVVTRKEENIVDAAKRMRMFHVGDLVVIERVGERRRPIGILTDRDIVLSVVASNPGYANCCVVDDVMTTDVITVRETEDLMEVLKKMQAHGVRRVPVVDDEGSLVGIVAFDDVARSLADEMNADKMNALIGVLASEHVREERYRV